jgi:large subunit ribosomal protein L18
MRRKFGSDVERRWSKRKLRSRKRLANTDRTLLTVYRSARHIYAQLVDPASGRTIASVSSRSAGVLGDVPYSGNRAAAARVGAEIARLAREKAIERVVFNRNGFLYHGRVKALADAAREAGLSF